MNVQENDSNCVRNSKLMLLTTAAVGVGAAYVLPTLVEWVSQLLIQHDVRNL